MGLAQAGRRPYLETMALPRPSSPRVLWADLQTFARERSKVQWIAALLAIAMPIVIVAGFIKDAKTNIAPGEQLTYVESWGSNRTDAESSRRRSSARPSGRRRRPSASASSRRSRKSSGM
jgi:hypothetical protein